MEMLPPWFFESSETPTVYHYTSANTARLMVEGKAIWLSEFTSMNDASEFAYAHRRLVELMNDGSSELSPLPRFFIEKAVEGLGANTGLVLGSLTAERDNLGQWRSYADDGAGCVLAIDAHFLHNDAGVAVRNIMTRR